MPVSSYDLRGIPADVSHVVVIHTDSYAGNFERRLCAYATGGIGDCEVGEEYREMFNDEMADCQFFHNGEMVDFTSIADDYLEHVSDDGCYRPVRICRATDDPKAPSNSVMIFFNQWDDDLTSSVLPVIRERAIEFAKTYRSWSQAPITPFNILDVEVIQIGHEEPTQFVLAARSLANHVAGETGYAEFLTSVPHGAQLYIKVPVKS